MLEDYEGNYAIITNSMKRVKWFYKNKPNVVLGYTIDATNYRKPFLFKRYDFLNIDVSLFNDKEVRKIRENKLVIGHLINTKEQYSLKKDVCDNLVLDNVLEIV